jgi:hypothetical protein
MLAVQALVSIGLITMIPYLSVKSAYVGLYQAAAVACGLMLSLGIGSIIKARFLGKLLAAPISIWRWPLLLAAAAAAIVGMAFVALPPRFEWIELAVGVPAILGLYSWIIWRWGFGPEDRVLFRKSEPDAP